MVRMRERLGVVRRKGGGREGEGLALDARSECVRGIKGCVREGLSLGCCRG